MAIAPVIRSMGKYYLQLIPLKKKTLINRAKSKGVRMVTNRCAKQNEEEEEDQLKQARLGSKMLKLMMYEQ